MFKCKGSSTIFYSLRNYSTSVKNKLGGIVKVHTWPPKINENEVSHPIFSFPAALAGTGHLGHSSLEIIPYNEEFTDKYIKMYLSIWEKASIIVNDLSESLGALPESSSSNIKPAQNVYSFEDDNKYENAMPKETIEFKLTCKEFIMIADEVKRLIKLSENDLSDVLNTDEIIQWTTKTNCTYYVALALTKGGIFPEKELSTLLPWTPLSFSARLSKIKESRKGIEKYFDSLQINNSP